VPTFNAQSDRRYTRVQKEAGLKANNLSEKAEQALTTLRKQTYQSNGPRCQYIAYGL
jgi:hypothetical protein